MLSHYPHVATQVEQQVAEVVAELVFAMLFNGTVHTSNKFSNKLGHIFVQPIIQESLANAKVKARQHCVSLSCLCNSLTQIEWVADFSLGDLESENIASERYENRHLRRPLFCLTAHISRTPANICITLISLESTFTGLHFRC